MSIKGKGNKKSADARIQFKPSPEQEPPYFTFGENSASALSDLTQSEKLGEKEKSIISAIFELCAETETRTVDSKSLRTHLWEIEQDNKLRTAKPISSSALRKRLQPLCDLDVVSKKTIPKEKGMKGRGATLYEVNLIDEKLPQLTGRVLTGTHLPMEPSTEQNEIDVAQNQAVRIDDFWCQIIAAVLPINDQSQIKQIDSSVSFKGTRIPITVTSQVDSRIPTIRSIKTIIALLTIAEIIIKDRKKQGTEPLKRFTIELSQILKVMRTPNEGGHRINILNHLKQWNGTMFTFGDLPASELHEINERFDTSNFGFSTHQLIQQLAGVGTLKENQKIPTAISFELPTDLVNRIAADGVYNLFTVTPSIMKESKPLAIALHFYCRKKLGQRGKLLTPKLKTLWKDTAPTMAYSDFSASFIKLLEDRQEEARPTKKKSGVLKIQNVNILGYLITLNNQQLTIVPDQEDKYVGTMTKHKFLVQKKEREESSKVTQKYLKKPSLHK